MDHSPKSSPLEGPTDFISLAWPYASNEHGNPTNGILDGGVVKIANLAAGIPVTYPVAVAATWYLRYSRPKET